MMGKGSWKRFFTLAGAAVLLQLLLLLAYGAVVAALGPKPVTAQEYFNVYQISPLQMVLRSDLLMMLMIGLYLVTFPALYAALREINPAFTLLALIMTVVAVTLSMANDPGFALLNLGAQYAQAGSEASQAQLLAAGEALMPANNWSSSASYMAGLLLQGSGVMISLIMLGGRDFCKATALAGLLGNGLDLIQHILHPFVPSISDWIMPVMGIFYIVWFPLLARDLFRLGKGLSSD